MRRALLPALELAPRAERKVTLKSGLNPDSWLKETLRRINNSRPKGIPRRTLSDDRQYQIYLEDVLSMPLWNLCSLTVSRVPASKVRKNPNALAETLLNNQHIHIGAYVECLDLDNYMVDFKLMKHSVEELVQYHRDVFSLDLAANIHDWPDKSSQLKRLQEEFREAVEEFVYRTHAYVLDNIGPDYFGELPPWRTEEVHEIIQKLFRNLMPPPANNKQSYPAHLG